MKNFVALDFETAQGKRYSACAVGIVVVKDNVITDKYFQLIQPPGNEYFYKNTQIHGINAKMTASSPTFDQVYPTIKKYVNDNLVVCHNAKFDVDVLSKCMSYYGIDDDIDFEYDCTMALNGGKGLKSCCQAFEIPLNHHNALSDAEACAMLYISSNTESSLHGHKFQSPSQTVGNCFFPELLSELKWVHELRGVLVGLILDNRINDKEISELRTWTESIYHQSEVEQVKELFRLMTEATDESCVSIELIKDMFEFCNDFELPFFNDSKVLPVQLMYGILHGIMADGVINDDEIRELNKLLNAYPEISSRTPFNQIKNLTDKILKDDSIDERERLELEAVIYSYIEIIDESIDSNIRNMVAKAELDSFFDNPESIEFNDRLFCLSGTFVNGNKAEIECLITEAGGLTKSSLVKKTNYLVVGSLGDPSWSYGSYGRKIEKAIEMQKKGVDILIVNEPDFIKLINQ
ncbi:exonuclease domain-containing protein [Sunxiuqinia sp. sy24]|uniref:exonuclease domain-containing protein n=1 Tax=Sunxiuqinia sp. sy24 TaxID=3461495 RepID=UPI0040452961